MNLPRRDVVLLLFLGLWKITLSFVVRQNSRTNVSLYRLRTTCYLTNNNNNNNWLGDLWQEVIEFSTYGPSERRVLKARREASAAKRVDDSDNRDLATTPLDRDPFASNDDDLSSERSESNTAVSMKAFQAAKSAVQTRTKESNGNESQGPTFDGYALRDLIVARWGVPLDVSFQRGDSGKSVYVTILPVVAFDDPTNHRRRSRQARHDNELEYLQHLQAVIEILDRYDNLSPWLVFLETTTKVPRPGTESVPFRLILSPSDQTKILGGTSS
jgi:hypothetical protein